MNIRAKLAVAGIVLVAAIAYLASASMKSGGWVYYLEVDHYLTDAQYKTQRVRLHGKVAEDGAMTSSAAGLTAKFNLSGKTSKVAVDYHGAIPDMFAAGREVVVEGRMAASGQVFEADVLMTKCASKYESNSPHATAEGGAAAAAAAGVPGGK